MKKRGFTLIELLAVIAILAILIVIAVPGILGLFRTSKDNVFVTEAKTIFREAEKQFQTNAMIKQSKRYFETGELDIKTNKEYSVVLDQEGKVIALNMYDNDKCVSLSDPNGIKINEITAADLESTLQVCQNFDITDYGVGGTVEFSNLTSTNGNLSVKITSQNSLTGYILTTSNSETAPTSGYTSISGTTYTLTNNALTEGTYYLWVKDNQNATTKMGESVLIDRTEPTVTYTNTNTNGTWNKIAFSVTASDNLSGIKEYRYYIDNVIKYTGTQTTYSQTYTTGTAANIKIEVEDNKGNVKTYTTTYSVIQCFVAGTKILAEKGLVNIEDIKVGDKVYAINLTTNNKELKTVLKTITNETHELYEIKVGGEIIKATPRHEFYVVDKGWVRAFGLEEGDVLLSSTKGEMPIEKIEYKKLEQAVKVYNFTVDNIHNYLITNSEYLVHNAPSST